MQRLEVSGAVQLIYKSSGVKGLRSSAFRHAVLMIYWTNNHNILQQHLPVGFCSRHGCILCAVRPGFYHKI